MKNTFFLLFATFVSMLSANLMAQAPNAFNYQAVLRDAGGNIMANQSVTMRFSIRHNNATGTVQYQETKALTTNAFGMANHAIGTGTAVTGTMSSVTWASGTKFLQVEVNPGTGFVSLGTEQLRSVPYALNAGGQVWTSSGSNISNTNTGNVGIGTSSPASELHVKSNSGNCDLLLSPQSGTGWNFGALSGNNNDLRIARYNNGNFTDILNITTSNRVGVNTISPSQELDINGRMNIGNGVIQRGGTAITATNDLGLYSRVNGNYLRIVSNSGQIKFYTDEGPNGIGVDNGGEAFEISGDADGANGHLAIINTSSNDASLVSTVNNYGQVGTNDNRMYRMYCNTYYGVNTSIQGLSDRSLKKNVAPLQTGLNAILQLRPVSYDFIVEKLYKNQEARDRADSRDVNNQMGFIAQELEEVLPGLIREVVEEDGTELKTVGYSNLIPVLVKGMQEQQAQIEAQQKQIDELKQLVLELSQK